MITIRSILSLDDNTEQLAQRLIVALEAQAVASDGLNHSISALAEIIGQTSAPSVTVIVSGQSIHVPGLAIGEDDMYTVERDHQNEPFTLDPISVTDSEGDVPFEETLETDNPEAVAIVDGENGKEFSFGTIGGANVTRKATVNGQSFIVATAQFNVTPGNITVAGGGINVPGLTPDPEQ